LSHTGHIPLRKGRWAGRRVDAAGGPFRCLYTGKNGFRLSPRGYLPDPDHVQRTRDLKGRRINCQQTEDSLMLLNGTGVGQAFPPDRQAGKPDLQVGSRGRGPFRARVPFIIRFYGTGSRRETGRLGCRQGERRPGDLSQPGQCLPILRFVAGSAHSLHDSHETHRCFGWKWLRRFFGFVSRRAHLFLRMCVTCNATNPIVQPVGHDGGISRTPCHGRIL
jgi:hypothetical protein